MLYDRNYMRNDGSYKDAREGLQCVYILLAINVIVFLMIPQSTTLYGLLTLTPEGIRHFYLWQLVSSMFLHGGFMHIFFNMWGLYLFGTIVAPILGARRFLAMYFISGIAGGLLWLAFNWNSPAGVVGASGAIFGVMLATAMLSPDQQFIMLFFPFPMKTKTLVTVYAIIEVFNELSVKDNVAHLAHLGGFIAAYFYIKYLYRNRFLPWDMFGFLFSKRRSTGGGKTKGWRVYNAPEPSADSGDDDKPVNQAELNMLLDKISLHGINSLSEREIHRLKKAREQMRS